MITLEQASQLIHNRSLAYLEREYLHDTALIKAQQAVEEAIVIIDNELQQFHGYEEFSELTEAQLELFDELYAIYDVLNHSK